MIRALVAFFSVFCVSASAGTIGLNLASKHDTGKWCEKNPGVYFVSESGIGGGVFRNSECNTAGWAGVLFQTDGAVKVGAVVGGVVGYKRGPMPLVLPTVSVGNFRWFYIPKVSRDGSAAVHVAVEWKLP